ncbi:preprotein translocase subunit YajC [Stakelama sediminis]|uniref:Sec translocon accessory complex subunit YajC n=1 Tax=Stakelama sediminis TaxID=463200 RepID=A0A840YV71_9SPHN|nr:preprotein translocase subunit YajC [Stakelama sediminis]MBB5717460.1 preprotein translocase subunit YajC [Stakelama sediminis]
MFITPAFASTAGAAGAQGSTAGAILSFAPLILIFLAFWFLMIRPQQKRMRDHQKAVNAVKRGDQVVTGGGLVGKVTKVDDQYAEIELAQGMKVRAVKSTLSEVITPGTAKPAND